MLNSDHLAGLEAANRLSLGNPAATMADIPSAATLAAINQAIIDANTAISNIQTGGTVATTTILKTAPETAILDNDTIPFIKDVGAILKKISWTNIKATLKIYFDTLYVLVSGTTIKTINSTTLLGSGDITLQTPLSKAAGSDINTGTDDAKYVTSKAIADSSLSKIININPQADDYTLVLTDAGKLVTINYATGKSLIIPKNSGVLFLVGTQISVCGIGAGQITIAPIDSDVTIISADGALKLRVQYSVATIIKTATNTWLLTGDITS